jgi:hypothetical protein
MLDFTKTLPATGTGAGDGAILGTLKDGQIRLLRRFVLQVVSGTVRVFGSVDGTNYPTAPLVLSLEPAVDGSDNVTEAQGTFVATATTGRLYYFFGQYKSLKFLQKGATGAAVRIYGTMDG